MKLTASTKWLRRYVLKTIQRFFKIGVKNFDPTDLFDNEFQVSNNCIVASPDVGGLLRAMMLALKSGTGLSMINKACNSDGKCIMSNMIGDITEKDCIIVDEISR